MFLPQLGSRVILLDATSILSYLFFNEHLGYIPGTEIPKKNHRMDFPSRRVQNIPRRELVVGRLQDKGPMQAKVSKVKRPVRAEV